MRRIIFAVAVYTTIAHASKSFGSILLLSSPGIGRMNGLLVLAEELKSYGYKITTVLPESHAKHKLLEPFGFDIIVSDGMTKFDISFQESSSSAVRAGFSGSSDWMFEVFKIRWFCTYLAEDEALMRILRERSFDVALIDTVFVNTCTSVIPYKLSIPFIHYGRMFQVQWMRSLIHPGAYPAAPVLPMSDKMTYIQRLSNTLLYTLLSIAPDPFNPVNMVGTYAPERPHLTNEQLQARTELYLLDTDELIDYHLPVYPNTKLVGGVVTRPAEPLKGDLKIFMESAVDGAVIVSFGSIVKMFPDQVFNKLMAAFHKLEQLKFVFRYGNSSYVDGNVMLVPWIPQNDLLGHSHTKLFISHCGTNGQFEALYHAVPIVGFPIFGDQLYNSVRIKEKGFGEYLGIAEFTEEQLISIINKVLKTPSYTQNIRKASNIFKSRALTPAKRAAWWIDHVIKYGGGHLRSAVVDLPSYQFLMIDVVAGLLVLFLLASLTCLFSCRFICRKCCQVKAKQD